MHAGRCEIFGHTLRFFSEATSFFIVFQRHSRMQEQRTTTMCISWRDACGKLRNFCSPVLFFSGATSYIIMFQRHFSSDGPAAGVWERGRAMQEHPPPVFYDWWECVRERVLKGSSVQTVSHLTIENVTVNCDNMSLVSTTSFLWLRRVCQITFFEG